MAEFFKYTAPSAQTSMITGEPLEDIKYSKIGAKPLISKIGPKVARVASAVSRISQKELDDLEADWKELSLDFTQLGLTVVGLIEVAEPIQITADVINGGIDISRGHPIIGAISMFSATPLAGLLGGIPLTLIRAFKCLFNGMKFLCKSFIVLTVKTGYSVGKFIWLKKGVLLSYSKKLKKFVENGISKGMEDLPKVSENLINQIKAFGEKLAKEKATVVNQTVQDTTSSSLVQSLKNPLHTDKIKHPTNGIKNYYPPDSTNRMDYILRTNTGKPLIW